MLPRSERLGAGSGRLGASPGTCGLLSSQTSGVEGGGRRLVAPPAVPPLLAAAARIISWYVFLCLSNICVTVTSFRNEGYRTDEDGLTVAWTRRSPLNVWVTGPNARQRHTFKIKSCKTSSLTTPQQEWYTQKQTFKIKSLKNIESHNTSA